jgi:hypothetical protein
MMGFVARIGPGLIGTSTARGTNDFRLQSPGTMPYLSH